MLDDTVAKFLVDTIENLKTELKGVRKVINENINNELSMQKKIVELEDLNDQQEEHIKWLEKRLAEAREELQMSKESLALTQSALDDETRKPSAYVDFRSILADWQHSQIPIVDKAKEEYEKRIDEALDDHEGEGI